MKYVKPQTLYDGLCKMNSKFPVAELARGKANLLLGLDIRQNFVGLALSDYLSSQAYPIMPCKNHMDSVTRYFPGLISQYSIYGFIVGKPRHVQYPHLKGDDEVHVEKFIFDLCSTGKFKGLKHTYWYDVYASKHIEFQYERNVENFPEFNDLPLINQEILVQKYTAVGTLKAYLDHFRDVKIECQNANEKLDAKK